MIGCNDVVVQERNQMIKKLAASQHYLNTTPAPQPTYIPTKPQATGTCSVQYYKTHPEINKAAAAIQYIYTAKPVLIYVNTSIASPMPGVPDSFIHPLTLTGVENTTITTAYTEQKLEKNTPTVARSSPTVTGNKNGNKCNTARNPQCSRIQYSWSFRSHQL